MDELNNSSILVTGGTGSFGKAFTKIVLKEYTPKKLIIFSRDELKQHEMQQEDCFNKENIRYFLGDIRDQDRLMRAMHGIDFVIHAAALKHVPACEYNPFEAVQTNILGSSNIINAAIDCGVKKVLALSTDKAVNPVNLYGATKMVAEKLFIQGNSYSGSANTHFACVRYGNVVGSRGSVIPVFQKQCKTGTVTLTDERMTRFWLTLDQGVRFVIRCMDEMRGGEIFIPKIPSMKIADLAKVIAPDCIQKNVGIRQGEKLHEVLLSEDEARHTVERDNSFVIQPENPSWTNKEWKEANVSDGFRYASDSNKEWLSPKQLQELLGMNTPPEPSHEGTK